MKSPEEVADKMYELIAQGKGQRKFTPRELQAASTELFGDAVDKKTCKDAIKHLMNTGRCVYSTYGGVSYVEIPPEKTSG